MKNLINFRYGVLIFNNEHGTENQVSFTLTNKMFEYLQCGLPSVACWCPESMKFVEKHGIGFNFKHIEEIGNMTQFDNQYLSVMGNIRTKRKELVMENYIVLLENLLAEVLNLEKKGIPENIQRIHDLEFKD